MTHLRHWLCIAPIVSVPIEVAISADAMRRLSLGTDMQRREFITLVAAAWPLAAHAQPPGENAFA